MSRLSAKGLSLCLGGRQILDSIDLDLTSEQAVVLVGPSGAGKSTLLHALLGLQAIQSGEVRIDGAELKRLSGRQRAAKLGWLPQMGYLQEPLAVIEFVASARFRFDEGRGQCLAASREALAACGLDGIGDQSVTSLSGGELQRAAMASLLAQDPAWFLLDEPSNHLDLRRQRELYRQLGAQWRAGRGMVLITHDINLLQALEAPDPSLIRVIGIHEGRLAWQRRYDDGDLDDRLGELMGLPMRSIEIAGKRHIVPWDGDGGQP